MLLEGLSEFSHRISPNSCGNRHVGQTLVSLYGNCLFVNDNVGHTVYNVCAGQIYSIVNGIRKIIRSRKGMRIRARINCQKNICRERIGAHFTYAIRNNNACELLTAPKCSASNLGYRFGKNDTNKVGTFAKHTIRNLRNVCRDLYNRKPLTICKDRRTDVYKTFGKRNTCNRFTI